PAKTASGGSWPKIGTNSPETAAASVGGAGGRPPATPKLSAGVAIAAGGAPALEAPRDGPQMASTPPPQVRPIPEVAIDEELGSRPAARRVGGRRDSINPRPLARAVPPPRKREGGLADALVDHTEARCANMKLIV